jgi:hypothetical protein
MYEMYLYPSIRVVIRIMLMSLNQRYIWYANYRNLYAAASAWWIAAAQLHSYKTCFVPVLFKVLTLVLSFVILKSNPEVFIPLFTTNDDQRTSQYKRSFWSPAKLRDSHVRQRQVPFSLKTHWLTRVDPLLKEPNIPSTSSSPCHKLHRRSQLQEQESRITSQCR